MQVNGDTKKYRKNYNNKKVQVNGNTKKIQKKL